MDVLRATCLLLLFLATLFICSGAENATCDKRCEQKCEADCKEACNTEGFWLDANGPQLCHDICGTECKKAGGNIGTINDPKFKKCEIKTCYEPCAAGISLKQGAGEAWNTCILRCITRPAGVAPKDVDCAEPTPATTTTTTPAPLEDCPPETSTEQDVVILLDASAQASPEVYKEAAHFAVKLSSFFAEPSRVSFMTYTKEVVRIHFGLRAKSRIWPKDPDQWGAWNVVMEGEYDEIKMLPLSPEEMYPRITKPAEDLDVDEVVEVQGGPVEAAIAELQGNTREGVPQKIVVLTDGATPLPVNPPIHRAIEAAEKAKEQNIAMFSVGLGPNSQSETAQKELRALADNVDRNRFGVKDDFERVLSQIRGFRIRDWQAAECKMPSDDIPKACYKENDLVIVLDGSRSVSFLDYHKATRFVARLAMAFIPPNRVSFVTYSDEVQVRFGIDSGLDPDDQLDQINVHSRAIGATYTGGAIEKATEILNGSPRDRVPQKIVVLTDGESTIPSTETSLEAGYPEAKEYTKNAVGKVGDHITTFSVGIGKYAQDEAWGGELLMIAKGVKENNFAVDNFDELLKRLRDISETICVAGSPPEIPSSTTTTTTPKPTTTPKQTTTTAKPTTTATTTPKPTPATTKVTFKPGRG